MMKADGSAEDIDAQYVRANCIQSEEVGLVELITPEVTAQQYANSASAIQMLMLARAAGER